MDLIVAFAIGLLVVAVICIGFLWLLSRGKSKARQVVRQRIQALDDARQLLEEKRYDLAIIKAFASIELALKFVGETYADYDPLKNSFEMIGFLQQKGRLDRDLAGRVHTIRMLRNKAVHEKAPISSNDAKQAVETTVILLSRLGFAT